MDGRERRAGVREQWLHVRPREPGALPERFRAHAGHPARGQLHDTRGAAGAGPKLPEAGVPRATDEVRGEPRLQPLEQDLRQPLQSALREPQ